MKTGDLYILSGTFFLAISNIVSRLAVKKNNPLLVAVLSGLFWAANVILFNFSLQRIGATLTTSIVMIGPIITMVLEATFLSYHFTPLQYFAALIVVFCGAAIALKRR